MENAKDTIQSQATHSGQRAGPSRFSVGGISVSVVTPETAVAVMERWIDDGERSYVCVTGSHGIVESQEDDQLKAIHNTAGLVVPDGKPVVWLGRLLGHRGISRCYGPDLMLVFCSNGLANRRRHFLYGGGDGVAEALSASLQSRFPSIEIVGTHTPPFRPLTGDEETEVVRVINDAGPDVVWVGLSTPRQELWMSAFRDRLEAPVLVGCGAAFDFNAGLKARAPKWIGEAGLEWLFRLLTEPRRLWRRYFKIVPGFLVLAALALFRKHLDARRDGN